MKDEEQRVGIDRPFQRKEIFQRAQEGRDHRFAIGLGGADCRDRQPLRVAELLDHLNGIHHQLLQGTPS